MTRYHVRTDGSMGVCTAREGNCPYGGEEGGEALHECAVSGDFFLKMMNPTS